MRVANVVSLRVDLAGDGMIATCNVSEAHLVFEHELPHRRQSCACMACDPARNNGMPPATHGVMVEWWLRELLERAQRSPGSARLHRVRGMVPALRAAYRLGGDAAVWALLHAPEVA